MTFVDVAPIERSSKGRRAENPVLRELRVADALLEVVRLWDDDADPHPEGSIDAVIFLRDPMWALPHGADVHALVRVCELENVPLATNPASAEALIQHLLA